MIMVPRQTKRAINSIDDSTWAVRYFFLFLLYLCDLLSPLRLIYFRSTWFFICSSADYMFLIKFHVVSLKMIFSRHKLTNIKSIFSSWIPAFCFLAVKQKQRDDYYYCSIPTLFNIHNCEYWVYEKSTRYEWVNLNKTLYIFFFCFVWEINELEWKKSYANGNDREK